MVVGLIAVGETTPLSAASFQILLIFTTEDESNLNYEGHLGIFLFILVLLFLPFLEVLRLKNSMWTESFAVYKFMKLMADNRISRIIREFLLSNKIKT